MSLTEHAKLDGRGTEELYAELAGAISELPPVHPMRVLWDRLDETLAVNGREALPSPWDDERKMASLEPAVTDWALQPVDAGLVYCASRDDARTLNAKASHVAIACRKPGGQWATPAATAAHIDAAVAVPAELNTDDLHAAIGHAATQFPTAHPVCTLWRQLHRVLALSGPEALPSPWDDAEPNEPDGVYGGEIR